MTGIKHFLFCKQCLAEAPKDDKLGVFPYMRQQTGISANGDIIVECSRHGREIIRIQNVDQVVSEGKNITLKDLM